MNRLTEEALFALALEKPVGKRAAFLDAVCEGDAALRARLEALLAAHERGNPALDDGPGVKATMKIELADAPDEAVGQVIGRYKVLQKIGEGGCGAVYMAEQEQPVRRRVALKVIKLGMDTKAVIARFEAERQALALMDHPNIAKVLDAGSTETGRPYFVMELVRGIKFTEYCDQNKLATRERLELFIKICQAIQYAHQKGIIHRDIKPSNILVTLHDGVPIPKVIDFGIAKATTDQRLTDKTLFTAYEQFIGTPAYMSPEQAEMSGLDIDTRSDIYSLGVLLYELLTGRTPFDPKELMESGIDAMRKTIREKEPVRPSTKVATLQGDDLTTTAARHAVEAPKLVSLLRGDLDWIVMKCLEKDRTRRYETANGLAVDLKRHLANETVNARPPSQLYRFQKAVRRNKIAFAAAGAVVSALFLGIIATTWQSIHASKAEAMALQSRSQAERLLNFILEDFYTQLEPIGQYEIVAGLAGQVIAYYDSLPASLRTAQTERNRAMAQARLAWIAAHQGNHKVAHATASAALASFDRMLAGGDESEETIFGAGVAMDAEAWNSRVQTDLQQSQSWVQKGAELLKPLASSPKGSPRVKLLYADVLNLLSHYLPPKEGIATAEEALQILSGLGALNWSNLPATTTYADTADSEARESLILGHMEDAKRLEKQTKSLAEGVLARRPGDLKAMKDVAEAGELLGEIAAEQFHEADALQSFSTGQTAAENLVRSNPSDARAWELLGKIAYLGAARSFRAGHVTEALQKARAAAEWHTEQMIDNDRNYLARFRIREHEIAPWEAQRGNRLAADLAFQQATLSLQAVATIENWSDAIRRLNQADLESSGRAVTMAFDENAEVYAAASSALDRLKGFDQASPNGPQTLKNRALEAASFNDSYNDPLSLKHNALEDTARAALNLGRYAEAEAAARTLASLPITDNHPENVHMFQPPDARSWAQTLMAQAQAGAGRKEEALKTLEPALAEFRQMQIQGASDVRFRQRFARALYVQSLAELSDSGGLTRRRDELNQSEKLLQALTEEAKQLHDSKELFAWIAAEQKKLGAPQP